MRPIVPRSRNKRLIHHAGYHRRLRERKGLTSTLDEIPGIGPKRRQALLKHFGSLEAIREASVEELAAVKSMNREVAERVKEQL